MPPARPETTLSTSLGESCPSGYAIGLTTVNRFDRWYNTEFSLSSFHTAAQLPAVCAACSSNYDDL